MALSKLTIPQELVEFNDQNDDISWEYFNDHFNLSTIGGGGDAIESNQLQAVGHRTAIQEIARTLHRIGDEIDEQYRLTFIEKISAQLKEISKEKIHYYDKLKENLAQVWNCFQKVVNVVDAVLEWLEKNSLTVMENLKKHEGVLRGVTKIAELANQVGGVALVRLTSSCLEGTHVPFEAERQLIRNCLDSIGKHQEEITREVETVSSILDEIVRSKDWDQSLADDFDNHVRIATVAISKCKKRLDATEKTINELLFKLNSVKWFHRGMRGVGLGLSCFAVYEMYARGAIPKVIALGAGVISVFTWTSLFPSPMYQACTELKKMEAERTHLALKLDELATDLMSAHQHKLLVAQNRTDAAF